MSLQSCAYVVNEIKTKFMLSSVEQFDRWLFTLINSRLSATWLDGIMLLLREPLTWVPLYIVMLVWSFRKMPAQAWWFLVLSALTFAITDFTSSSIIKPWIERERPCYDAALGDTIRSLVGCGGRYSMPSSHASNHFGLAMFWFSTIRLVTGKKWHWLWVWALMICYAQVYVGKHFPGDIVAGCLLGMLAGWLMFRAFSYFCYGYKKRQSIAAI